MPFFETHFLLSVLVTDWTLSEPYKKSCWNKGVSAVCLKNKIFLKSKEIWNAKDVCLVQSRNILTNSEFLNQMVLEFFHK